MTSSHLTEEAFLSLAGKKLSGEPLRAVEEHLSGCAQCRRQYEEFCFAYSVVARMAEIGYQEALGPEAATPSTPKESKKTGRGFTFPWKPVIGIAIACLCVMAFLFYPRFSPTVSAAELLSRASQNEDLSQDMNAFQVRIGDQTCVDTRPHKKAVTFDASVRCGRALQHIQSTPWGSGNPLSAKTYGSWRSSLHQRKDHVAKRDASWELQTETDEGAVHTAMLELRVADYHATKLTLGFTDEEEISISEMTTALPAPPAEEVAMASMPLKADAKDDPSDLLEARAWATLHQLHADSGWEAMVLRNGSEVKMIAVVAEDSRKQELEEGFAAYPGINVEIHSPSNPGDISKLFPARVRFISGAPALAAPWLKEQFADSDARVAFSNEALQASREILGRPAFLDTLRQRQVALAHCSCARVMAVLVSDEKRALGDSEKRLSAELESMLGGPVMPSSRVLTVSDATHLDALLHELLWSGSDEDGATFDTSVQQVRDLLTEKKRGSRTVMAVNRSDWNKH